jgi:hypothetical protein
MERTGQRSKETHWWMQKENEIFIISHQLGAVEHEKVRPFNWNIYVLLQCLYFVFWDEKIELFKFLEITFSSESKTNTWIRQF